MTVDLFCVQPHMQADDYYTREAFYHKIDRYFQAASQSRQPGRPALIVFPEDLATFLLLEGQENLVRGVDTIDQAFAAIGRKALLPLLWTMLQYGTLKVKRAFFTHGASRVWHIWHATMARLAHDYQMTVVAGSALIPESRWIYDSNRYMPVSPKVYNLSFTVGPDGHVIYHTRKVNLVPTQEDVLELTPAPLESALAVVTLPQTHIPMATVICYDAFVRPHSTQEPHFVNVLQALDAQGVKLIAQPSANPWKWDARWPFDPPTSTRTRAQQWDDEGSRAALAQCQHVEIVVNPQLQLSFLDLCFQGPSRILARDGRAVKILVEAELNGTAPDDLVLYSSWDFAPQGL